MSSNGDNILELGLKQAPTLRHWCERIELQAAIAAPRLEVSESAGVR
jgi:hypothetical protein